MAAVCTESFSADSCVLWCSLEAQLMQLTCASGHNVALLPGLLSADSESCQVTLPPGPL